MRTGLTVSVIGHVALFAWGIISLPSPKSLDISNLEMVPVDFVPIDELTKLNLGVTKAEAREEIVPEPPSKVVAEVPPPPTPRPEPPSPPEPTPEQETAMLPPPELPPPEPEPEPAPPEPQPVPEPAVAPEPPPPPPEPAVAPKPEPKQELVKWKTVPVPRSRPTPPKTVVADAKPKEETLDTDKISALLDKSQPTGSTAPTETPPTLGSSTGSIVAEMSVNELDALRARLAQCWNITLAPPDPAELRVKVKMRLNQDGSLSQSPEVLEVGSTEFARTAAETAVRAVRRCAPYNFLPPEKYDSWREINMVFDPREMFGGG
jgi:hypothetical protein